MAYQLSGLGVQFLKVREGFRTKAYKDTVGIWTIGIGSTRYPDGKPVKSGDVLTKVQAFELFQHTVGQYEKAVNEAVKAPITQSQFDALVSFCYNVGVTGFKGSTLVKQINKGLANNRDEMKKCFLMWLKNPELRGRREREVELFNLAKYSEQ